MTKLTTVTVVVVLAMTAMAWQPTAAEEQVAAAPQVSAECQLLSSSPNGYAAVARKLVTVDAAEAALHQTRAACSGSDNASCYVQCINSGFSGGICCCSCGSVALCNCWR